MNETVFAQDLPKGVVRGNRGAYGGTTIDVGRVEVTQGTLHLGYIKDKDIPNAIALAFHPRKGEKPIRVFTENTPEKRQNLVFVLEQAIQAIKELGDGPA